MENMCIITEEQAKQAITMTTAIRIVREAYTANVNGEMSAGGRIVIPIQGEENCGQWLVATGTKIPVFGAKFSSVFPANLKKGMPSVISQISLYSAQTGEPLAIIGANYLTAVKTGANSAVATDLLARKDSAKLGIIGSGIQAYTQLLAIQEIRNLTELRIYDLSAERIDSFSEMIEPLRNRPYKIIKCKSANECVENSDIISTCTTSLSPVFDAASLKPGTHLNAVGSFTPFMQEIDEQAVVKTDKIVTEHLDGLWAAAGDILIPVEKGIISRDKVNGTVGEVLVGKIQGRESDTEITMLESVGSCVLDVAVAIAVYERIKGQTS